MDDARLIAVIPPISKLNEELQRFLFRGNTHCMRSPKNNRRNPKKNNWFIFTPSSSFFNNI